jgi:excisionase family DNA binding protein
MSTSNTPLLSVSEAAEYLRISVFTLRTWVSQRKLSFIKLGSRVLFRREDLELFVASRVIKPGH